jgi:hypothetical protein
MSKKSYKKIVVTSIRLLTKVTGSRIRIRTNMPRIGNTCVTDTFTFQRHLYVLQHGREGHGLHQAGEGDDLRFPD